MKRLGVFEVAKDSMVSHILDGQLADAQNKSATHTVELLLADEEDLQHAARSLKAMAHPLRLKILCILGGAKEVSVQDLVDRVGTSQSNISQHLSILRDKGILASRKDANKVYYRIGDRKILRLMGTMRDALCVSRSG